MIPILFSRFEEEFHLLADSIKKVFPHQKLEVRITTSFPLRFFFSQKSSSALTAEQFLFPANKTVNFSACPRPLPLALSRFKPQFSPVREKSNRPRSSCFYIACIFKQFLAFCSDERVKTPKKAPKIFRPTRRRIFQTNWPFFF